MTFLRALLKEVFQQNQCAISKRYREPREDAEKGKTQHPLQKQLPRHSHVSNWKRNSSLWRQGGESLREERGKRLRRGGKEEMVMGGKKGGRGESQRQVGTETERHRERLGSHDVKASLWQLQVHN